MASRGPYPPGTPSPRRWYLGINAVAAIKMEILAKGLGHWTGGKRKERAFAGDSSSLFFFTFLW